MTSSKKHPHILKPSQEEIWKLLKNNDPNIFQLYLNIHCLLLATIPDVVYSIDCTDGVMGYGAYQYGYSGWGMAALAPHKKWVSLIFFQGINLEDPSNLLEGAGKRMRHVKVRTSEELKAYYSPLCGLLEAAVSFFKKG